MRALSMTLTMLLLGTTAGAEASLNSQWNKERALFEKAQKTPASKRPDTIRKTLPKLGEYPLKPYLEYQLISRDLSLRSGKKVRNFQKNYPLSPLTRSMQSEWLQFLYKKSRWNDYLREFDRLSLNGAAHQCRTQLARLNSKSSKVRSSVWKETDKLWLVGKSQPKVCDPLFKQWRQAGNLTSRKALQRFWLSVEKGNLSMARYLERYISSRGDKLHVKRFNEVRKNPAILFRQVRKTDDLRTLSYGLKRTLRKQPERTISYWQKVRTSRKLSVEQRAAIETMLAQRLVTHSNQAKFKLIGQLNRKNEIPEVTEAHLRLLLQKQDWKKITQLVATLPEETRKSDIWMYWNSVAVKQSSANPIALKEANRSLLKLAEKRQYYGYLAATLTGQAYSLQADQPDQRKQQRKKLLANPAIQRAIELTKVGRDAQASAEWRSALAKMSETEQKHAALLADEMGWHFLAIISAVRAGAWDLVEARFPRPYAGTFRKFSKKRDIDEHWALAIARQESAFNPQARSHAGARGLMQLMPATAKETARSHKVKYRSTRQLYTPSTNISLGTAYLSDMLKRFDGNRALASAAYNAGPHRVKRWLKERGELPLDIWIESIPFKETRRYVKNVLTYRVIYQLNSGQRGMFMEKNEIARLSIKPVPQAQLLVLAKPDNKDTKTTQ